jgi:hypothetical protein
MWASRFGHAPGGPLGTAAATLGDSALDGQASEYLARLTQRTRAGFRPKRAARPAECAESSIAGGVSKWLAGPIDRSAKNEPNGFALSPFALVTFIWGRK